MLHIWTFHTKGKLFKLAGNASLVSKTCVSGHFRPIQDCEFLGLRKSDQNTTLKNSKWPPQAHRASDNTHLQYQPTPYHTQQFKKNGKNSCILAQVITLSSLICGSAGSGGEDKPIILPKVNDIIIIAPDYCKSICVVCNILKFHTQLPSISSVCHLD